MATGDRTEKRLVGPLQLANASAALGSSITSTYTWVIKQIILCNTSGTDRLVYLSIGNDTTDASSTASSPASQAAPANRFVNALPVAAFDTVVLDTALVLVGSATAGAADRLWGYADSASAVTVTVVGWQKTN
jgi:hypothetical protein